MAKFKLCPDCGEHVSPALVICPACSADLCGVPVTDEAAEARKQKKREEEARAAAAAKEEAEKNARAEELARENATAPKGRPVRICPDCSRKNRSMARVCEACGRFIADVPPTENLPAFRLVSLRGDFRIPVKGKEPLVIGRGAVGWAKMKDAVYVGREHARISLRLGALWIESLGTAKTYVGGRLIEAPTRLSVGDVIGLAVADISHPHAGGAVFLRVEAEQE